MQSIQVVEHDNNRILVLRQIDALDEISAELQRIDSLLTLLNDYFIMQNPDDVELKHRYKIYSNLVDVIQDIVIIQKMHIDESIGVLMQTTIKR